MVVERDVVVVSIPFAMGVAASAFIGASFSATHFLLCAAASLMLSFYRHAGILVFLLTYFFLGAFCWSGNSLFCLERTGSSGIASDALNTLSGWIEDIPFPHDRTNALLRALLTGQRDMLSPECIAIFRASGASHILALSGLHLGMIYLIAGRLLLPLGNGIPALYIRSTILVVLSAFYTVMTGASPSIMRAFLFIVLNEFSRLSPGRERRPLNIWCSALMMQLAIMPSAISSIGFQLSYLAMLGIFILFPEMESWYPHSGRWDMLRKAWSMLSLSCSCQIFTAPLAYWRFGTFPMYFMLTNLLAMPLVSILMTAAIASLILSVCGICPLWLIIMTDSLAEALQGCLETISGM